VQGFRERLGREVADVLDLSSEAEGAEDAEDETVDVKEGKCVGETVARRPLPDVGERIEVRDDRAPRDHHALGRTGRTRGVENDRRLLGLELVGQGPTGSGSLDVEPFQAGERGRKLDAARGEDEVGGAVREHVLDLSRSSPRVDRNERDAGGHGSDHGDAGLQAGRGPDGDALDALKPVGEACRG
jgi:hypothetical protein